MKRLRAAAAALLAGSAIALLVPGQAMASGPIYPGDGDCSFSWNPNLPGPSGFFCTYSFSGGTGPFTATATVSPPSPKVHVTTIGVSSGSGSIGGTCTLGYSGFVTINLVDSLGNTGSVGAALSCQKFAQ